MRTKEQIYNDPEEEDEEEENTGDGHPIKPTGK